MKTLWRVAGLVNLMLLFAACQNAPATVPTDLPEGDPARGEMVFTQEIDGAPSCASCHTLTDEPGVGPGLAGYGQRAGSVVEGQNAETYTYLAIVAPADHLVAGYGNLMYTNYGSALDEQQIADLIAYLLEQ